MLSLTLNDEAIRAVGVLAGLAAAAPPGGLAPGLRDRLARGIGRRAEVLTWTGSPGGPIDEHPYADLTGWECSDSCFHLEDHVPVPVALLDDGTPRIAPEDQRTLFLHGLAFALEFGRLVHGLEQPGPVRCIVAVNETNGTFRFHRIRPGEYWNHPELDRYRAELMAVVDFEPDRV